MGVAVEDLRGVPMLLGSANRFWQFSRPANPLIPFRCSTAGTTVSQPRRSARQ